MLPAGLDLQTMSFIMWIVIAISIVAGLMIIFSLEKPVLRVLTTIIIATLILTCYMYTKQLNKCDSTGTTCTFFSLEIPQDGGFIN